MNAIKYQGTNKLFTALMEDDNKNDYAKYELELLGISISPNKTQILFNTYLKKYNFRAIMIKRCNMNIAINPELIYCNLM